MDASNRELLYLRNRIRRELLPYLTRDYNPNVKSLLTGMARVLRADEEYLSGQAERNFSEVAKEENQQIVVDVDKLKSLHLSIQRRVLRKGIESVKGNLRGISLTQLDDILGIVNGPSGLEIHLPRGIVARRCYRNLTISKTPESKGRKYDSRTALIKVPGETEIGEFHIRVRCSLLSRERVRLPSKGSLPEENVACFDFQELRGPLFIRYRRPGDSFQPLGMGGRKKLKDFFIDRKVPREERNEIPLLVQGEDILWVIGYRQGGEAKVTGKTKKVLRVEISRSNHREHREKT